MTLFRYLVLLVLLTGLVCSVSNFSSVYVRNNITIVANATAPKYCIGTDCITAWSSTGSLWDITTSVYLYNNSNILEFNTTAGDLRYIKDTDEANLNVNRSTYWNDETSQSDLNVNDSDYLDGLDSTDFILTTNEGNLDVNSSNETTYWDGETSQADLNVNDSNSSSYSNETAYWDNLNSPIDINTADLTDDGTYFQNTGEDTIILGDNTTTTQTLMTILNAVGQGYELIYNNTLYGWESYVYQYGANVDAVIHEFSDEGRLIVETTDMNRDAVFMLRHDNASHINTSRTWYLRNFGEGALNKLSFIYAEGVNLTDVSINVMSLYSNGVNIFLPLNMSDDINMFGNKINDVAQIDNGGNNISINDSLVLPAGENIYFEVTQEIEINPARFKLPGANFPAFDVVGMFPVLKFDPTINESAHSSMHVVEDYKEGSNFSIAFYWSPEDAGAGTVTWCIELTGLTAEIDETLNDAGTIYCISDDAQLTVMELLKTNLIEIDGTSISIDDEFGFRIYRGATVDTYAMDANLVEASIYYTSNRLGE